MTIAGYRLAAYLDQHARRTPPRNSGLITNSLEESRDRF